MKRLLFTALIALSMSMNAQEGKINGRLEKIVVYSPESPKILAVVKKKKNLSKVLDRIRFKKGYTEFNVVKYYSDGNVIQCKIKESKGNE